MAKKKAAPSPPTIEARNEALAVIHRSSEPITATQLSKQLVAPFKISAALLVPILEELVTNGKLNVFPPATARGQCRYWDRDLTEFVKVQIKQFLMKKGAQPQAKLKSAAKAVDEAQFLLAFQQLLESRHVFEHPPIGKSKVIKYGIEPPEAEPYLKDVVLQLANIVERLLAAGTDRTQLTRTLVAGLAQAGLSLVRLEAATVPAESPATQELNLLLLMRQIEPGAERGALVTARELRRAANLEKLVFDHTVMELARKGKLMLHRHDHASGLSASERDELVTDEMGTYYVGMVLRRSEA